VVAVNLNREPRDLLLNAERRQTGAQRVIFQCHRRAKDGHDAVPGELVDRAAVALHHRRSAIYQAEHDLAQRLRPDGCGDVHRVHHVGEQDGHQFVLSRLGGRVRQPRTALAAEFCRGAALRAAGTADQVRGGESTAVPAGVHASIMSLLIRDVA
jgi:hypothetical protein